MKGEFPGNAGWKGRISNLGVAKLKSNAARAPSSALGWMWLMLVHVFGVHVPALRTSGRKVFTRLVEVKVISSPATCGR